MPWWMTNTWYWIANLLMLSACYRWAAQARIGRQDYTYAKKCFNIECFDASPGEVGLAAAVTTANIIATAINPGRF
eukprot:341199-Amphidinium_carterae.2